jgi:hypothetical protein
VVQGPVPAAARPERRQVTVIRFAGAGPDLNAALTRLPGVRSVHADGGQVLVRAAAAASDEVLRTVLAHDGAHVLTVQEQTESPS